jgi:hypothetical protein
MAGRGENLRISVAATNVDGQSRRSRNRVLSKFNYRETLATASNYNGLNTLKKNYLDNLGLRTRGERNANNLHRGGEPSTSTEWVETPEFFANAMEIADKFNPNRTTTPHTARLFQSAFAEFITELEKVIQKRVLNREFIVAGASENVRTALFHQMSASLQNIFMEGRGDIQALNELYTRTASFNDSFWSNQEYKARWCADFRVLMDDTIKMLLNTFSPNPGVSYFGTLIPNLKSYVPEMFVGTPSSRHRPKGFIYKMDGNRDFLRVIFNIMMVRFPTLNTAKAEVWRTFNLNIALDRIPVGGQVVETTEIRPVTVYHTDTSLKNMFYYIPNQERVLGIWPKNVRVNRGGDGTALSTLNVNYNSQMIRSVLCKIRLGDEDQGSRVNYRLLFEDQVNNIYSRIRRMDPFQFGDDMDPYVRLFVSMTFFSESNDKILHVPWTIESLDSPLSPHRVGDGPNVPYDYSELLRIIIIILEGRMSGRTGEEDDGKVIYVIIKFISEHPREYYEPYLYRIDGVEQKNPEVQARTRQRQSLVPPPPPQQPSLDGFIVGAPYAGTDKERIFLNMSMVDRFRFNDALFQTPERPTTYSCFMMSVLRCQMYFYRFEGGVCQDVLVTNGPRADMTCCGKFVQATMDYSGCQQCLPFIRKMDGEYYIHLFNNVKHTLDGKFLPGSRNEEENQYWELAADEIWLHLERFCGREINYNDLGDYGQVFADFFNVCISIYDVEYRGNRIAVLTPYNKSPYDLAMEGEILMIHIVFDQGHIHAVNNLRNFIRSKKRKTDVRQTHYCPVCDKKQTDALTCSKNSALKHITECSKKCDKFKTGFEREENIRVESQHCQVRSVFRKVKGKNRMVTECTQCYQEVSQLNFSSHVCTIQQKKLESIPDEKIWVWDVEAAQLEDEFHLLKHECNCVYIRRVYFDPGTPEEPNPLAEGRYFPSEVEFVDALMTEADFQNSVFLAHNGGSYDIHFLLRIFERSEIDHTFTPSPTSKHKFIKVQLTERNIHFLDFIRFMPGSLRSIAESFQIPVSKGDFPYKFNNGLNDSYVGRIPPLDTEHDYWGLQEARSQKQVDSFRGWYQEQTLVYCTCDTPECSCGKKRWVFQDELKKYCLLDVVVLAEVVKAYRNKVLSFETVHDESFPDASIPWSIPKIDPFQFMTLPQITMQTLVHGMSPQSYENYGFHGITSYFNSYRSSRCPEALLWLKKCSEIEEVFIQSRENSTREFYEFQLKMSFDGYAPMTNTVYIFLKCSFWGCTTCMRDFHDCNGIIPERGIPAKDVEEHFQVVMHHLHSNYTVKTIWQHEYNTMWMDPYYLKCVQQMSPSDCFYGGRTEVFKLYCNSDQFPGQKIHYYDVTSLYPSVYAHRMLPVGNPRYLIGYDINKDRLCPTHPNRYFGYVRVHVTPRNTDRIGLLPQRDVKTQRLTFPVHPMEGCWFTEELYLAMENGYIVDEVYEIYFWESNQLSDQHLRGYVGYFLKMKQEAEGWKKLGASCENPTVEEQNEIADRLYVQNGNLARIRPEKVKFDPVMRALAKLFLNSLWGKWAQKAAKECQTTIYGTQQFFQLWNDLTVEKESCLFRDISPGVYKVSYKKKDPFINPVPHGNVWLAAAVTAWARITLHKQMLRIGPERLVYCDTDSIIFLWPEDGEKLSGVGLGHWTDEYPNHDIKQVYALAPKLYALIVADKNDPNNRKESFRAKGVQMTLVNQMKMSFQNILPLIQKTVLDKSMSHTIEVNNFSIFTNSTNNQLPFGNLFSRYNTKNVRVIMTKRTVEELLECDFETLAEINTYPPGYQ